MGKKNSTTDAKTSEPPQGDTGTSKDKCDSSSPDLKAIEKTRQEQICKLSHSLFGETSALAKHSATAAPYIAKGLVQTEYNLLPMLVTSLIAAQEFLVWLDKTFDMGRIAPLVLGLAMCFFGGTFPMMIAAAESFRVAGWQQVKPHYRELRVEITKALHATRVDAQRDGTSSPLQIPDSKEALLRKTAVIAGAVQPEAVSRALAGVGAGLFAMLAALKMQFARAFALGAALAEAVRDPAHKSLVPKIKQTVAEEYQQWVPVGVDWFLKCMAVMVALILQRIIGAFHSAIRGGSLAAEPLVDIVREEAKKRKIEVPPMLRADLVAYALAAFGFLWQLWSGFTVYFPLNLMLLPLSISESLLTTAVAWL